MKRFLFYFIIFVLAFSCNKKTGPEEALRAFVNYRFESNQTREKILSMVDGSLKLEIERMKPSSFEKFVSIENFRKKKLIINIKNCENESKCFLTYTLIYKQLKDGVKVRDLEVKKIAELISYEEGIWKISNVNSVKSYIDSHQTIGVPAEGTAKKP